MAQMKIISVIGAVMGIFSVCMIVLWRHQPQLQDVAGIIAMSEDMSCYLVDNSENNPIIYEVDTEGNAVNFLQTTEEDGQQEIVQINWDGEGISYLKQVYDNMQQVSYHLYTCDSRLGQETDQGNIALNDEERPLTLTKGIRQWELVTIDKKGKKVYVYQISENKRSEHGSLVLELLQEVDAKEQEWFCDAAYSGDRLYILNNYGRVKCYHEGKREKNKKLYRRKTTELTAVRAGLFCQLRAGKLELLTDGTLIELQAVGNLWALDAMSAKANVQLGIRGMGEKYLVFHQPELEVEVSSLKLPRRLWIPFHKSSLVRAICLIVLTYVILGLIWFCLKKSKKRAGLMIAIVSGQIALGIVLVCGIAIGREFLLSKQQKNTGQLWAQSVAENLEGLDFYTMNLKGFAKNGLIERLQTALITQIFQMEGQWAQQSAAVVSYKLSGTAVVLAAGEDAYGSQLDAVMPWEILELLDEARESGQIQSKIIGDKFTGFSKENHCTVWSILPLGERVVPSVFLISKLEVREKNNLVWFWLTIGWLVMEMLLGIVVTILQRNSVDHFVKAVEASIAGTRRKSPVHWQGAFSTAWVEVQKQLARLERKKNQQLEDQEAYDRFIPQYFAQLMGHHEIRDLKLGEQCKVTGTFFYALLEAPEKLMQKNSTYIQQVNEMIELFQSKTVASKGMIFSEKSDPGKLCIVYKEQIEEALQTALEIWQHLNDNKNVKEQIPIAFLLHYHTCLCGLTGSKKEVFPFVYAPEMEILKKCTQFLQQAQVRLTITEELLPYLKQNQRCRYIGYVKGVIEGEIFRFYEILEVYPEHEKQKRFAAAEKFSQALELFYQNDFYLARLLFMEILKECPQDHLARHNLFVCERMFQTQSPEEINYQLVEFT